MLNDEVNYFIILFLDKVWQTIEPNTWNVFTQTEGKYGRGKKDKGDGMIANQKISRMQTYKPQTFRGGGFLYYSKSIEEDASNNQQKPSFYEDHFWLAQSSKGWGELKLNHPKLKGDNRLESFKSNSNIGNHPFVIK